MADNIYDVKVGDKLTPAQIRQAAGGGRGILSKESSPDGTNKEEVVIAEKKFENAQDESKKSPDAQTETQPEVIDEFVSYRYPLDMSPNYPVESHSLHIKSRVWTSVKNWVISLGKHLNGTNSETEGK